MKKLRIFAAFAIVAALVFAVTPVDAKGAGPNANPDRCVYQMEGFEGRMQGRGDRGFEDQRNPDGTCDLGICPFQGEGNENGGNGNGTQKQDGTGNPDPIQKKDGTGNPNASRGMRDGSGEGRGAGRGEGMNKMDGTGNPEGLGKNRMPDGTCRGNK